ncbi:sensor histidine kinase [Azospirillum halopraeferens]|uniref:sensor histidine kinase n=1 Tax=Azospirillum halopraeferens TaxID=34010 RepID=UPI0003F6B6BB|nr:ATP-binding protein [Azospirillum halopraeferens]
MKIAVLVAIFLIAVSGLWSRPAAAAAVTVAAGPGATDVVALVPALEVLFDPDGVLSLDDVAPERGGGGGFRPLAEGPSSFGQTTGALWGRVRLDLRDAAAADRWLLAIETLLIARADIHLVGDDGAVLLHAVRGLAVDAVPAGEIQDRVDLTPFAGREMTLYLSIRSRFALVMTPVLRTALAQMRHEAEMLRMHAPLAGSMASVALLFGAHWLLLRIRLYGYAFGAALGILATSVFGSGLNRAYGLSWADNADWWILEGGGVLGLYCLPLFVATYLDLPEHRPVVHRRLHRVVAAMTAANLALMVMLPHRLLTGLTVTFFAVAAISLWLMLLQRGVGGRERGSLLLAMGPFLVLTSLHLVAFNRWAPELLPWRGWVRELFTMGLATLLIGFALAVADQMRVRLETLVARRTRELTEANARTEEALVAEQAARQRLRQFIRMAAHEFKTPLAVIDGAAQVLPLLVQPLADDARRRLDNIRANVRRLLGLIDACFAEDRLDETGLVLHTAPFDPMAMIEDVVQHHRLLHARTIRVRIGTPPPSIDGDATMLRMVFSAVLDNAAKYSPPPSPIEVKIGGAPDRLEVRILDRGCGVPAADRENLFRRYFRASNVTAVPGTGLGLYLARAIVVRHGGSLSLDDRDGGGTAVTIRLPAAGRE